MKLSLTLFFCPDSGLNSECVPNLRRLAQKMVWNSYNLPHADRVMTDISEAANLKLPNPKTDGLLPFVIQRLANYQKPIQEMGHEIKFAIARGPLNIASFLMGTTELMTGFMMDPENSHRLLETITQFSINWIQHQKEMFPGIEGILVLDDIVGFIGDDECQEYAVPYIKRIFDSFDSKLNFFTTMHRVWFRHHI